MTISRHRRSGPTEPAAYARRLALAAILSCLVHLLLWNGLNTTRLSLLGGTPQDATAREPILKPKLAADFPLLVPKSPVSAQAAHERPLDMQVVPRERQEPPRPVPDRTPPVPQPSPAPEEPAPVVVVPPAVERSASPRDAAAQPRPTDVAGTLERQRLEAIAAPSGTAAQAAVAPGVAPPAAAPRPTPLPPRSTTPDATAMAGRSLGETVTAPALPAPPPLPARPTIARRDEPSAPQPQPAAASPRRGLAAIAVPGPADARARAAVPRGASAGDDAAPAATVVRPQPAPTPLSRVRPLVERGTAAAGGGRTTADTAEQDPAAGGNATPDVTGLMAARADNAAAAAEERSAAGDAVSPQPLVRSSPAGAGDSAAMAAAGSTTTAVAVPAPAVATAGKTAVGADDGGPMPAAMAGIGGRRPAAARSPNAAAAGGANVEADDGELSSVAEADGASGTDFLAGLRAGRDRGESAAVALEVRPLGRSAAVALPIEGRVREIAIPFARRSRANRDARSRNQPEGDLVIREKTRAAADAMVDRGLDFLARAQQADGRWRLGAFPGATAADEPKLSCDTAATGLAILSFLGAGHDHFGGRHRDTVRRGLEFLLSVQKPDGDLFVPADPLSNSCGWLYSHGIASMALCEAVGMTGDAVVKPAAARACAFIAASQHPVRGGWRYTPRSDADLSVSGWMLVALRSGSLAGVDVEPRAFDGVKKLLESSAVADDPARYHYNARNPQQRPSPLSAGCMTAVGALMRLHTGSTAEDPRVRQSARALTALRPTYGQGRDKTRDCYLWYYASQVLVHTGGEEWAEWYDELAATLERTQERDGPRAGSWDPLGAVPDRWGPYGGRIYVTALHLLALEVPDRRLPTYGSADDTTGR